MSLALPTPLLEELPPANGFEPLALDAVELPMLAPVAEVLAPLDEPPPNRLARPLAASPLDEEEELPLWLGSPALPKIDCTVTPGKLRSEPNGLCFSRSVIELSEYWLDELPPLPKLLKSYW